MKITEKIDLLPEDVPEEIISRTAGELEMLHFTPTLLMDLPGFLYLKKSDIKMEAERILSLDADRLPEYDADKFSGIDDFKNKQLEMLFFHYELLTRLRAGVPEAWDYVHELYEDD